MFIFESIHNKTSHTKKIRLSPLRMANQDVITKEVFKYVSSNSNITKIREQISKANNRKETALV